MPFFSRGRAKLSRLHVNSFGAGGGPLPPPIPPNGLVFYDFKQSDLTKAITEIVRGQQVLQTTRAADLNVVQSSSPSIISYGANTAGFDVGVGMLVEKDGQNLFTANNVALWNGFRAFTTNTTEDPYGDTVPFIDLEDLRIFPTTAPVVADDDYAAGIWIKANKSADLKIRRPSAQDIAIQVNTEWQFFEATGQPVATSSNALLLDGRFSQGLGAAGLEVAVAGMQFQPGTQLTSPIDTINTPATRDATISEISTVLEAGYLIDDGCYLGNLTNGTFNGGVQVRPDFSAETSITFVGGGKYGNVGFTEDLLNARIIVGNDTFPIISFTNQNTFRIGDCAAFTNSELISLLSNDGTNTNRITLDFSESNYITNDFATGVAAIEQLRIDAGDDLSGFETPSQWPVNDFITSFDVIIVNKEISGTTNPTIYECTTASAGIVISLTDVPNDQVKIEKRVGGQIEAQLSVTLGEPIVDGDLLSVSFSQSPTDGFTFTVNGVSAIDAAALSDIAIGSVARLASMPPSNNVLPTKWHNFTIQSPIPPPPPVVSVLIVDDVSAEIVPNAVAYGSIGLPTDPNGSLTPLQTIGERDWAMYTNDSPAFGGKAAILLPATPWDAPKVAVLRFDGVDFTFTTDPNNPSGDVIACLGADIFDFLAAREGVPIQFEIVSVEDYVVSGFGDDFGDDF